MPLLSAAFKCSRNLVWESCSSFFSDCITFIYYIEDSLQVQRSFWIANYPKLNTKSLSERNQFDSFPGLLFDMPRLFSCNGFSLNFFPSQLFFIQRFPFGFLLFIIAQTIIFRILVWERRCMGQVKMMKHLQYGFQKDFYSMCVLSACIFTAYSQSINCRSFPLQSFARFDLLEKIILK